MTPSLSQAVNGSHLSHGTYRGASRNRNFLLILLVLTPIVLFYCLLFKSLTGLPFNDDYKATLEFVLQFKQAHGLGKLFPILTHRHNEYLLIFQNAIYAVQYELVGQVKLKFLTVCGDLLVLPLFGTLWLLWSEYRLPRPFAYFAFVPASWMLFQLQYASTLNCVMAPLQNVAVLIFALLAFYYGARTRDQGRSDLDFTWSMLFLVLSIAASGGGLLVGPVLCLLYLQQRTWKRLTITAVISAFLGWLYLYERYRHEPPSAVAVATASTPVQHHAPSLSFAAAFLGSIAAGSRPAPAIVFGFLLVGLFVYATVNLLYRRNPALYCSMLFFFVQSLAVSQTRAGRGLSTALGSRYRINSIVLVILLYFFLAERLQGFRLPRRWQFAGVAAMAIVLLGFNLASNRAGYRLLHLRRLLVQRGVLQWERHTPVPAQTSTDEPDYMGQNAREGMYDPIEPLLTESLQAGIYTLPAPGPNQ